MKPIIEMFCDAIDTQPVSFDWDPYKLNRTWNIVLPDVSDANLETMRRLLEAYEVDIPDHLINPVTMDRTALVEAYGVEPDEDLNNFTDEELREEITYRIESTMMDGIEDWRDFVGDQIQEQSDRYVPMMSFFYTIPSYDGNAALDQITLELEGGPVCLAQVNDKSVLALTAGGMDLSDQIVWAYMLMGYLPPLHFCRLPAFAGTKLTEKGKLLLAACRRSCEVTRNRIVWIEKDLDQLEETWKSRT